MISPSMMLTSGTMPPSGIRLSCMVLTAPQEASVVIGGEQRGIGDPEADFLALHVAAGLHALGVWSTWSAAKAGLPGASAQ